jgi:aldose 1-epimerase
MSGAVRTIAGDVRTLAWRDQRAVVGEVGATLRSYSAGDEEILDGQGPTGIVSGGRGQVLAPWPNRLEDGSFTFAGTTAQAALDEPERRNAIHGLVRWLAWTVTDEGAAMIRLSCPLAAQPAYPFVLDLSVTYALGESGLTVTTQAANAGDRALPFGIGFHPYLRAPGGSVDGTCLTLPASRRLLLDERGLPTGDQPVEGTDYDFRGGRAIGSARLDDCFCGLDRGEDGRVEIAIAGAHGDDGVVLWADRAFGWIMCYTGDTLGEVSRRRQSVAIEPMTCPPNALRTGVGVVRVEQGESFVARWGIGRQEQVK